MMTLPATVATALTDVIDPALRLLPGPMTSGRARTMLGAIALQESGLAYRKQIGGPAHGLWMFQEDGGCQGVLTHHATHDTARALCAKRHVSPSATAVYEALTEDDLLAAGLARLLLWTDPHPLPTPGDEWDGWDVYTRCWRPGRPRPTHWSANYRQALTAVQDYGDDH